MENDRKLVEQKWKEIFHTDLPQYVHVAYAKKYIQWQKENPTFDKPLQKQIQKLVSDYENGILNTSNSTLIKSEIKIGTKFIRDFKGRKYEVTKLESGFEYCGKVYKSLSAIANEITGTRWNGKKFFGIK